MDVPNNVKIAKSTIPNAGLGAFATKHLKIGQILGDYTGEEVTEDADGDYVLMIQGYNSKGKSVNRFIDAQDPSSGWPRYLNSIRKGDGLKKNCKFFINGDRVSVKTLRDIEPGEELLVDYGQEYF
jgi:SET domain-containing protein